MVMAILQDYAPIIVIQMKDRLQTYMMDKQGRDDRLIKWTNEVRVNSFYSSLQ